VWLIPTATGRRFACVFSILVFFFELTFASLNSRLPFSWLLNT
jgi:hypothetical protein